MTKRAPLDEEIPQLREAFRGVSEADLRLAVPLSLLCVPRLISIGECVRLTFGKEGETAEIGCASGGTSRLIALSNFGRRHWACDTFKGLVDVGPNDGALRNGMFARPRESASAARQRVRDLLAGTSAQLVAGKFPDSAPSAMRAARYCFVHIDVDTYESMKAAFAFFAPRMVTGGLVALDDTASGGAPGAQRFWRELVEGRQTGAWERFRQAEQQIVVRFH